MTWHAYTNGETVRYLLNPEDEDLTGWTELKLPIGFNPHTGSWLVVKGRIVADVLKMEANDWAELRAERNERLAQTDWTQLADVPKNVKAAFKVYRKALRDIPLMVKNPVEPVWPEFPDI